MVLALIFAAVFAGLGWWSVEVDAVSAETKALVLTGVVAFTLGGGAGRRVAQVSVAANAGTYPVRARAGAALLLLLSAAFAPVFLKLRDVHERVGADNILESVNVSSSEAELSWGIHLWIYRWLLALTLFLLVRYAADRKDRFLRRLAQLAAAITFVATIAFTSRGMALSFLAGIFFAGYLTRIMSGRMLATGVLAVFAPIFVVSAVLRGHFGGEGDLEATLETAEIVFRNYFIGGVAGFDQTVTSYTALEWGSNSLRSLGLWLGHLGLPIEVRPLVQEFRAVPFLTNVFTAFEPYYRDFGVAGVKAPPLAPARGPDPDLVDPLPDYDLAEPAP